MQQERSDQALQKDILFTRTYLQTRSKPSTFKRTKTGQIQDLPLTPLSTQKSKTYKKGNAQWTLPRLKNLYPYRRNVYAICIE